MNRRNFFASLISAVVVNVSTELGVSDSGGWEPLSQDLIDRLTPRLPVKGKWYWWPVVDGKRVEYPIEFSHDTELLDRLWEQRHREEYPWLVESKQPTI